MRIDNSTWGDLPRTINNSPHRDSNMTCFACLRLGDQLFWLPPVDAATAKCPIVIMKVETVATSPPITISSTRRRIYAWSRWHGNGQSYRAVRSSSAVLVSSRTRIASGFILSSRTVSAEGFSGQTFNTHVPHTVRATETKGCSDCHISKTNDNNAWMAQTLLLGTNFVNFMDVMCMSRRRRAGRWWQPSVASPRRSSAARCTGLLIRTTIEICQWRKRTARGL